MNRFSHPPPHCKKQCGVENVNDASFDCALHHFIRLQDLLFFFLFSYFCASLWISVMQLQWREATADGGEERGSGGVEERGRRQPPRTALVRVRETEACDTLHRAPNERQATTVAGQQD